MSRSWMAYGKCAGKSTRDFFPSTGLGVEKARKVCQECLVQEACLNYALSNRIRYGVWGGRSERERRRLLRRSAA
ncbi:WhiB family transcriptional regulator [Candidatus Poriferisocius sp.]|uniref:WhiB family transcriptional regulator n=1 Tax=Candidatus Poriferisocius sp. TaxID=3101276 RepID=UPI003B018792